MVKLNWIILTNQIVDKNNYDKFQENVIFLKIFIFDSYIFDNSQFLN